MKRDSYNKLYEFLLLNSGTEINLRDVIEKFGTKKLEKKKKNKRDISGGKVESLLEFLRALELESLITIKKKTIEVHRPFLLQGKISLSKGGMVL